MPSLTSADWSAVWLTFQLATVSTVILLLVGTPIAWWLARTRSKWKGVVGAVVALPLVLPPTVIGFYLLVAMGPNGPLGRLTEALGLGLLPFSFAGLVVGSVVYSLPGGCGYQMIAGVRYYACGGVWYEQRYAGSQLTYVVVPAR